MGFGFIIIRHVNSKLTDLYWKECYACIRKLYDEPILIIDDSSDTQYVDDTLQLVNCSIIYDTDHKGAAELLPYYYFHKLKPFDIAVIMHDSMFIQKKIDFELAPQENVRFFWSFVHTWDDEIFAHIDELLKGLPYYEQLIDLYHRKHDWIGAMGVTSVIRWSLVNSLHINFNLFESLLPKIQQRVNRCALERVLPLLIQFQEETVSAYFGNIHQYIPWGTTFFDYLQGKFPSHPIVKTWTGR